MPLSTVSLSDHRHVSTNQAGASAGRHWQMATSVQGSVTAVNAAQLTAL